MCVAVKQTALRCKGVVINCVMICKTSIVRRKVEGSHINKKQKS